MLYKKTRRISIEWLMSFLFVYSEASFGSLHANALDRNIWITSVCDLKLFDGRSMSTIFRVQCTENIFDLSHANVVRIQRFYLRVEKGEIKYNWYAHFRTRISQDISKLVMLYGCQSWCMQSANQLAVYSGRRYLFNGDWLNNIVIENTTSLFKVE